MTNAATADPLECAAACYAEYAAAYCAAHAARALTDPAPWIAAAQAVQAVEAAQRAAMLAGRVGPKRQWTRP